MYNLNIFTFGDLMSFWIYLCFLAWRKGEAAWGIQHIPRFAVLNVGHSNSGCVRTLIFLVWSPHSKCFLNRKSNLLFKNQFADSWLTISIRRSISYWLSQSWAAAPLYCFNFIGREIWYYKRRVMTVWKDICGVSIITFETTVNMTTFYIHTEAKSWCLWLDISRA